jgi:L-asparaginase
MQSTSHRIVILGTGGTIAGHAVSAADNVGYRSGAISVESLVTALPGLGKVPVDCEQVAQIDSKDMSFALWQRLAQRVQAHRDRPEVAGVVITHGTDTLEETAFFLHQVLAPGKPVVLTAAMRPTSSMQADGPQNLLDAVGVAGDPGAAGVVVVFGGQVFGAEGLRKVHGYRLDAFAAGESGPVAMIEEGHLRPLRPWPAPAGLGLQAVAADIGSWPRVAWVTSHAGFDAGQVDALVAAGFDGIVVAGTGNGTLHQALISALQRAQAGGVAVRLCSRCGQGRIVGASEFPTGEPLGPAQLRVALILELLAARC